MNPHLLVAIRSDLCRVARETGKPRGIAPSVMIYRDEGRHAEFRVRALVGGTVARYGTSIPRLKWSESMPHYGLRPAGSLRWPTRAEAIEDVRRVVRILGQGPLRAPSMDEYAAHGRWGHHALLKAITGCATASWYRVADEVGLHVEGRVRRGTLSRERVLEDFLRIALELGAAPTKVEFTARVAYTAEAAAYHWGKWSALTEAAGFEPRESPIGRGS